VYLNLADSSPGKWSGVGHRSHTSAKAREVKLRRVKAHDNIAVAEGMMSLLM